MKIGVIGTGGISWVHLGVLDKRPDVEITGLCDLKEEAAREKQEKFGGEIFLDFNEMLEKTELDAVWLCTPPQVRREPLIACAERGIPVLCEKPVERDAEEARSIAAELEKLNANVQVGYVFRSMQVINRLREAMADDRIHLIQSMYCCNMSIARKMPDWFFNKELSGGALIDQATHNLDLLRSLFGEVTEVSGFACNPFTEKSGEYTIDEAISLSMVFANGITASHVHTWVGDTWRNELVFSGEKRMYRVNLNAGTLIVEDGKEAPEFKQDGKSIFEYEIDTFITQVKTGNWENNPSSYADALKTLELTLACDRSIADGPQALT